MKYNFCQFWSYLKATFWRACRLVALHKNTGNTSLIQVLEDATGSRPDKENETHHLNQVLYMKEKYGISDAAYHELSLTLCFRIHVPSLVSLTQTSLFSCKGESSKFDSTKCSISFFLNDCCTPIVPSVVILLSFFYLACSLEVDYMLPLVSQWLR